MLTDLEYESKKLQRDIEREAAALVRKGVPLWAAMERAWKIVRRKRGENERTRANLQQVQATRVHAH